MKNLASNLENSSVEIQTTPRTSRQGRRQRVVSELSMGQLCYPQRDGHPLGTTEKRKGAVAV